MSLLTLEDRAGVASIGMVFTTDPVVDNCTVDAVFDEESTVGLPIWLLYKASQ